MIQVCLLLFLGTLCAESLGSRYVGCSMKPDPGPCFGYHVKYYFDSKENRCKTFNYGGCRGNKNRFDSMDRCSRACGVSTPSLNSNEVKNSSLPRRCLLKKNSGPCFGSLRMYYYNTNEGRCKMFKYGGCGGNSNRFYSMHRCKKTCRGRRTRPQTPRLCALKPKSGPCRAYFKKYYYDYKLRRCKMFVYGGCLGNANNFHSRQACEQRCGK